VSFSFHHLALSVQDLSRSMTFYRALGFAEVHRYEAPDGSIAISHLALGSMILELFCYTDVEVPAQPTTMGNDLPVAGIKHFGIAVESVRAAREVLVARGIDPECDIALGRTGIEYFFVQDPDGVWVELVQDDRELAA
jgi:glyoxylase I family protein